MRLAFGNGVSRRVYDISDWVLQYPDEWTMLCRPSFRTFLRRLIAAVLVIILAVFLWMPISTSRDPLLRTILLLCTSGMVLLGVLVPLSGFWERIRIVRQGDRFMVHAFQILPRRHACALSSLTRMNILQRELRSSRKSGRRRLGWRWLILVNTEAGGFGFWCDHQYEQVAPEDMPERVAECARHLQHIAGVPCEAAQTAEWGTGPRGACRTGRTLATTAGETHSRHLTSPWTRCRQRYGNTLRPPLVPTSDVSDVPWI